MIEAHAQTLVFKQNSGFGWMVTHEKLSQLELLHSIFSNSSVAKEILVDHLSKYIKEKGYNLIGDRSFFLNPDTLIRKLIEMRAKYSLIAQKSFHNDSTVLMAIKKAFEEFINHSNTSVKLVQYINNLLRRKILGLSPSEICLRIEETIQIFVLIQDKDRFEESYRESLKKRLLDQ